MFDGFKKRIILIYFGVSTIPLFIMLATVIGALFIIMSDNASADVLIISLLVITFLMFSASLIFSLVFIDYVKDISATLDAKLTKLLNEEQTKALSVGSGGNPYLLLLNSFDYYNNRAQLFEEEYRDFKIIKDASKYTTNIMWWKLKGDDNFHLNIPEYWTGTYPTINLAGVCRLYDNIHNKDVNIFKNTVKQAEENVGMRIKQRLKLRISSENYIQASVNACSYADEGGNVILTGAIIDINKIYELDCLNKEYESKFMFSLRAAEDVLLEMDIENDTSFIYTPKAWDNMFDIPKVTVEYKKERNTFWDKIHPDFKEGYLDRFLNFDHIITLPDKELSYEFIVKNRKGDFNWVEQTAKVVAEENGIAKKVLLYISDINERKSRELKRAMQSNHDSLTGALLRYAMKEDFEDYILAEENKMAIILIKINGLRHINDQYGFETGDKVLRSVVTACWGNSIQNCLVGRTDGDEFVITVKEPDDAVNSPVVIAGRIVNNYQQPTLIDRKKVNITLSVGIAYKDDIFKSFEDVYAAAYQAAEEAQNRGGSSFVIHSEIGSPEMVKFKKKENN